MAQNLITTSKTVVFWERSTYQSSAFSCCLQKIVTYAAVSDSTNNTS